ncbi:MAG: lysylphosphatidylglycerol synthetase family protein [Actinobacteria bacterium HGW-Actinobacteria-2]|nr:MAG: lysylphosphatidylglycerol synthetase family protein [Actinobacteria bacterium HGW-Actinobacteria-2]
MSEPEVSQDLVPAASSTSRATLVNVVRTVLLVLVIVAAGWQLIVHWNEVAATVAKLQWHRALLAQLAIVFGIMCSTLSWQVLLDDLGKPIGVGRGAQIFLVGQLGKYLPGSVWAYVLQIELGRKAGLERARVFAATVFSLVVAVVAALIAGSFAIPRLMAQDARLSWLPWLYLLLPFALAMLLPPVLTAIVRFGFTVLRRPRPDHPVTLRVVLASLAYAIGTYFFFGAHLWLLADTREGLTISPLSLCIGTMGIAMLAGLAAFMLPSGVGAREFVIIVALTPVVGVGPATAYAAVSRAMFILAEVGAAGVAAAVAVITKHRDREPSVVTIPTASD